MFTLRSLRHQLCDSCIRSESGNAILQVLFVSMMLTAAGFALSAYLTKHDKNTRRVIDRSTYLNVGIFTSEAVSYPTTVYNAQSVGNNIAYP